MKNNEKGISRVDTADTHGYHARVYFRGKTYSKLFSDSKWDGPEIARDEAISWRNEKEKALGKTRSNKHVSDLRATNTGVCGIKEITKKYINKQGNIQIEHVFQITNKKYRTTVSIRRYGPKKAMEIAMEKKKAIEARIKT